MLANKFNPLRRLSHILEAPVSSKKRVMSTLEQMREQSPPGLLKILERSPKRLERIKFLGELFKTAGFELRIAGGAVRDIIRGKEPKDIDFATTAHPERSLEIVKRHEDILRIIVTAAGQRHGTIAVKFKEAKIDFKKIKLSHHQEGDQSEQRDAAYVKDEPKYDDESPYEITTLRCDKLTDGRHAEVEFINDWQEDAKRRDLTINAMFLSLDDGSLIDYFDGESDLKNGIVKFVGDADKRVKEDFLRILRFFRFWSRYGQGKEPDESTLTVIRNNIDGLSQISGERIWQELKKILSYQPCYQVFELMLRLRAFDYTGLLDKDLKDYEEYSSSVLKEVKFVQENVQRYCDEILEPMRKVNPKDPQVKKIDELLPVILFACAVQRDVLCLEAYKRLRFSNLERDLILYIIENKNKSVTMDAYKYQLAMSPAPERHIVMQRITAYLVSRGDFDYINRLRDWKVPKFPIPGAVIANAVKERNLSSSKIKDIIEAIKLKWANNSYTSDKERLKMWIKLELDRLSETSEISGSNESNRLSKTPSNNSSEIDWPTDTSESSRSKESSTD